MPANLPDWLPATPAKAIRYYADVHGADMKPAELVLMKRRLICGDLFYLMLHGLGREGIVHPWLFDRCREVQAEPNGRLDLWAREHFKSSIITVGLTIQDILNDPEITVGIFSHTRPIAKSFLRVIKREFETNDKLKTLFPDILWANPASEASTWSEDSGIIVKRSSNPPEATVEAHGLVDGQPTARHFKLRVYDDVVTEASVSTPEQIEKTTKARQMSDNLGAKGGAERNVGTRYHLFDTYAEQIKTGTVIPRVHPATVDGTETGKPVLLTRDELAEKRKKQGPYVFASQQLLNPVADKAMGFKEDWIKFAIVSRSTAMATTNRYIVVDPASERRAKARKDPDYTSMWVIGLGAAKNFYLLDGIRDRLSLSGRAKAVIGLHRKWQPKGVGYEQYGMQADIEHIKYVQEQELYQFEITELGGQMSKPDRIKRLIPVFEDGRFWMPKSLLYKDHTGAMIDLIRVFIQEEYLAFPVCAHDDMCLVAGTLIATSKGNVPIENVRVGDLALTPDGYRKITAAGFTGMKPVVNRFGVIGTGNHPMFTIDDGYLTMDTITRIHRPLRLSLCSWIKIALLKSFISMEINTVGWADAVTTIYGSQRQMQDGRILKACMSRFGNFIRASQFRQATIFITSMATHLTTSMRTLLAFRLLCIKESLKRWTWSASERIWIVSAHWPRLGIAPRLAGNGTGRMPNGLWKRSLCLEAGNASNATATLYQRNPARPSSFARICADIDIGIGATAHPRTNIKSIAFNAAKSMWRKPKRRSGVPEVAPQDTGVKQAVYNLSVEGAHCYFANGVLVHNCDSMARILDPELSTIWPDPETPVDKQGFDYGDIEDANAGPDWTIA